MDALPYPNDPAKPPRINVTRSDAERLCSEKGARLCSELEWEYACKGQQNEVFAGGNEWDPTCAKEPMTCQSVFGVRAMGSLREWTSSDVASGDGRPSAPALRGAGVVAESKASRRCSARTRAFETQGKDIGFRCCKGAPATKETIPAAVALAMFRKSRFEAKEISTIVASVPELSRIGVDVRLFDPNDAPYLTRVTAAPREGFTFTTAPLFYTPEVGLDLLILTGKNRSMAFVVALFVLPDNHYRVASYLYFEGETQPVALAYQPNQKTLYWTTCWKCPGETGRVSVRDDHRVVIVQD